jgi:hypothetical protein
MIVVRGHRRIWRTAWQPLLVVIAIQVHRQQKLVLAALTAHAAGALLATDERGQQQCRKDGNNRNHHQKFRESKGGTGAALLVPPEAFGYPTRLGKPVHSSIWIERDSKPQLSGQVLEAL